MILTISFGLLTFMATNMVIKGKLPNIYDIILVVSTIICVYLASKGIITHYSEFCNEISNIGGVITGYLLGYHVIDNNVPWLRYFLELFSDGQNNNGGINGINGNNVNGTNGNNVNGTNGNAANGTNNGSTNNTPASNTPQPIFLEQFRFGGIN